MAITKLVETKLRDAVQRFTGATIPKGRHGLSLLNYAKTKKLIPEPRRGTDCLYYSIFWFLSNPRNKSHHIFTNFRLPTLLLCVTTANYILEEIGRLSEGDELYKAKVTINPLPNFKLSVTVEDLFKGAEPAEIGNLEIRLNAPDKTLRTIPLKEEEEDRWKTEFSYYGYSEGTY